MESSLLYIFFLLLWLLLLFLKRGGGTLGLEHTEHLFYYRAMVSFLEFKHKHLYKKKKIALALLLVLVKRGSHSQQEALIGAGAQNGQCAESRSPLSVQPYI